jgi:hypothetical protein
MSNMQRTKIFFLLKEAEGINIGNGLLTAAVLITDGSKKNSATQDS